MLLDPRATRSRLKNVIIDHHAATFNGTVNEHAGSVVKPDPSIQVYDRRDKRKL